MDSDPQRGAPADALHDVVLPDRLPLLPRLDLAASCLVTDDEPAGDWADVVALADGRVALLAGDAAGRGPQAVATALQLRTIVGERLRAGADLPSVLASVHAFAGQLSSARVATVCAALLDPDSGVLEYVTAGHAPPAIVRPDGQWQDLPPVGSGALAMAGRDGVGRTVVEAGGLVLLRTTGTLDRAWPAGAEPHDVGRSAGAAFSRTAGATASGATVETVCDRVLGALSADVAMVDDMVLLAAERMPAPYSVEMTLPAVPASLAVARAALREWLEDLKAVTRTSSLSSTP